jgi:hypothetical protein
VNATAVDTSGNMTKGSFTVTVTDALPPVITCPPNIVRPADPGTNVARVNFSAAATDNQPGVMVMCMPPPGSLFALGTTNVNCIAKDAAGNTASCTFTVTILDTEPPVITTPTNIISANDIGQCSAVVNFMVTVRDNLPGAIVVCAPPSGSTFPLGITTVVCIARDAAGNKATNSFRVTVIDTEKPALHLPADIVIPCAAGTANYTVTGTDNCSDVRVVCNPPSGSLFARGTNIVRCTGTDAAGNTATGSFNVIVQDNQPPVINSIRPSKSVLWPPNHKMIPITITVSATDDCGPVSSRIASVTSNQPTNSSGDGNTSTDWRITGTLSATLRADLTAERSGGGGDRIYTITIECKDAVGNVATGTTTVTVPHSSP